MSAHVSAAGGGVVGAAEALGEAPRVAPGVGSSAGTGSHPASSEAIVAAATTAGSRMRVQDGIPLDRTDTREPIGEHPAHHDQALQ